MNRQHDDYNNIECITSPVTSREDFSVAIRQSIELEKKGDDLKSRGMTHQAMKKYQKSLTIEEHILGKSHPVVSAFYEKLDEVNGWATSPTVSSQPVSLRLAAFALEESLELEKEGDRLWKIGKHDLARRKYEMAYSIEIIVVGEHHPMVSSLQEKITRISACSD
jgi:hypothetical protein